MYEITLELDHKNKPLWVKYAEKWEQKVEGSYVLDDLV